jgi:hypothetical protein
MRYGSLKRTFGFGAFGVGMYPLVVYGGFGKFVYLFLVNNVPGGGAEMVTQMRFKFGVVFNGYHKRSL